MLKSGPSATCAGPTPRDMDPLEVRVENGFVLVRFRRYRMGTADRVEVG